MSSFLSTTCGLGGIKDRCRKSPFLCWTFGLAIVVGVPLGVIVAITRGSPLAGLGSLIAVVVIGLLVCRKEVIGEYKERKGTSA
ncbi:MAG: hypothetical protein GTN81_14530 [Proteobacteria bacterium]|nr:hypothetical protein [Pseudomonadota bacterium]